MPESGTKPPSYWKILKYDRQVEQNTNRNGEKWIQHDSTNKNGD
jgi:hypothetical protein